MMQAPTLPEELQSLQSDPTAAQVLASLDDTTRDALYRLLSSLNHSVLESVQEACEEIDAQGGEVDTLVAVMKAKPVALELNQSGAEALQDLLAACRTIQADLFAEV